MTRIIGGVAGSRKLAAPAKSTRPTSDRVRESIFNRLEARDSLDGAAVLDLYAGTGALGLESLSRGAASLVLVESGRAAAAVCQRNLDLVLESLAAAKLKPQASIASRTVKAYLAGSVAQAGSFDLVFIDPPYEIANDEITHNLEELLPLLSSEATVVLERASRSGQPKIPEGYELEDAKNYGDTAIFWLARAS